MTWPWQTCLTAAHEHSHEAKETADKARAGSPKPRLDIPAPSGSSRCVDGIITSARKSMPGWRRSSTNGSPECRIGQARAINERAEIGERKETGHHAVISRPAMKKSSRVRSPAQVEADGLNRAKLEAMMTTSTPDNVNKLRHGDIAKAASSLFLACP